MHVSPAVDEGVDAASTTRKTPTRSPSTIHPRRESGSTSPGRSSGAKRGRQRAMAARVPLKLARGQPHLTGGCSHATCQPARPLLDLPPRFTLGARAARHHPADQAAQNGRQRAMDARVPLKERLMHECRSNWHGGDHTVVDAASTPSSTAGDTCIFQSCLRLFRGHVHTLGAWAPEFGP